MMVQNGSFYCTLMENTFKNIDYLSEITKLTMLNVFFSDCGPSQLLK